MQITLVPLRHGAPRSQAEMNRVAAAARALPSPTRCSRLALHDRRWVPTRRAYGLIWAIVRRLVPSVRPWRWGRGRRPTPVKAMPAPAVETRWAGPAGRGHAGAAAPSPRRRPCQPREL